MTEGGLPRALLACFFLASMVQSLPLVAIGVFLNDDVKMSFADQARFYALIFLPWSLKPAFAVIMDLAGGPTIRPKFVVLASIGTGLSLLYTGLFVTSVTEMYLVSLWRSLCEAWAEYGLSLTLIDVIVAQTRASAQLDHMLDSIGDLQPDTTSPKVPVSDLSARAQSRATSSRMLGSLLSSIIGLVFLYGCDDHLRISSRNIIALTSGLAFSMALVACALPVVVSSTTDTHSLVSTPPSLPYWRSKATLGGILLFQSFFIWIGIYSLLDFTLWIVVLALYLAFTLVILLTKSSSLSSLLLPLFLFSLNACPGLSEVWFGFSLFSLRSSTCDMQILDLVSQFASVGTCMCYSSVIAWMSFSWAKGGSQSRGISLVLAFTLLSGLVGLAGHLPLALQPPVPPSPGLGWFMLVSLISTVANQAQFLAQTVLITEASVGETHLSPGLMYGMYLSLLEFGDSASGWISAPLIAGLGLDYQTHSYGLLWVLVVVAQLSPVVMGAGFGGIFWMQRRYGKYNPMATPNDHLPLL